MSTNKIKLNTSIVSTSDKITSIVESMCNINVQTNMYSDTDFLYRDDTMYIEEFVNENSPMFKSIILEFCKKYIDDILMENTMSVSDGKYQIEIRKSHDTKNYLFCIESNDSKFYFEVRCDKLKKHMGY